jgi:hypothetical protein
MVEYWAVLKAHRLVVSMSVGWVNLTADETVLSMVMTAQHAAAHWVVSTGQSLAVYWVVVNWATLSAARLADCLECMKAEMWGHWKAVRLVDRTVALTDCKMADQTDVN